MNSEHATWVTTARDSAMGRVRLHGLPRRGVEYWKFTNPQALCEHVHLADGKFVLNSGTGDHRKVPSTVQSTLDDLECHEIDIRTGLTSGNGVCDVSLLSEEFARQDSWAAGIYGEIEGRSHDVPRQLAALNTAIASDGICIRARGISTHPFLINYDNADPSEFSMFHNLVKVEQLGMACIIEAGRPATKINRVLEVDVSDGGTLHHIQVQDHLDCGAGISSIFVRLGRAATFKSFTISTGNNLIRNECVISLEGDNGRAHVAGAAIGAAGFHHDDTVFITHDAEECESRQVFKKVLNDGAVGVFQGKILVRQDAQKTDGYQISQALLLDDSSQFLAKPELEIYADDVACSHGSTCGNLDSEAMFYLKSRGIPHQEARDILALGFLAEALVEVQEDDISDRLRIILSEWLKRSR